MKFKITDGNELAGSVGLITCKILTRSLEETDHIEINGIEPLDHQSDWKKAIELFDRWAETREMTYRLSRLSTFCNYEIRAIASSECLEFDTLSDLIHWLKKNELEPKRKPLIEFKKNQLVSVYEDQKLIAVGIIAISDEKSIDLLDSGCTYYLNAHTFYEYDPELDKV